MISLLVSCGTCLNAWVWDTLCLVIMGVGPAEGQQFVPLCDYWHLCHEMR